MLAKITAEEGTLQHVHEAVAVLGSAGQRGHSQHGLATIHHTVNLCAPWHQA